jgi:hypothetical protein
MFLSVSKSTALVARGRSIMDTSDRRAKQTFVENQDFALA